MLQEKLQILWNKKVGSGYYRIGLRCQEGFSTAKPGQFIMLRISDQIEPLLRRPFSIHRLVVNNGLTEGVEILYKIVGKGTLKLSLLKEGEFIDILGPLGNAFSLPRNPQHVYIVAGGIGVAPLVFLASILVKNGGDPSRCRVFIGGKSKDDLLCMDDFMRLGINVHTTTDDGSAGDQCLVTHPVEIAMQEARPDIMYACGPVEMLKCVLGIAEKYAVPCQVSIETMMACGVGACLGCAVEDRTDSGKYLHACLDGPVFDVQAISL
jgi:dihydroorotate dehydrogenase electron transfer subunit